MKRISFLSILFASSMTILAAYADTYADRASLESISYQLETLSHLKPGKPDQPPGSQQRASFQQGKFIEDVLGISETAFRDHFGWDKDRKNIKTRYKLTKNLHDLREKSVWMNAYPRRKLILAGVVRKTDVNKPAQSIYTGVQYGDYEFIYIGDLQSNVQAKRSLGPARFRVKIHDPLKPEESDIRALQANPQNKHAVFQIASTPVGLEGGMKRASKELTGMLSRPVQGEFASIGAAAAAIYRKYLRPTGRNTQDPYPSIFDRVKKGKPADVNKIGVIIHDNVYVTSGFFKNPGDAGKGMGENPKFEVEKIPISEQQTICQIFTSAYDTKRDRTQPTKSAGWQNFAKLVLNAAYKGTILSAVYKDKPKIFLTLMGGGSFANEISWIEYAITHDVVPLVGKHGLDVTLLYRADKKRMPPFDIRSVSTDTDFLMKMANHVAASKGVVLNENILSKADVNKYLEIAYDDRRKRAEKSEMSRLAKKLNEFFVS